MAIHSIVRICGAVALVAITWGSTSTSLYAQGHSPHAQPPVFVPPHPAPVVPPVLRMPQRPDIPQDTDANKDAPSLPDDMQPAKIDKDKVPEFVYMLGDSAAIDAYRLPPVTTNGGAFFCNWECEAEKMFPDAEDPYAEYRSLEVEKSRIREERYNYIFSGNALPDGLRIGLVSFTDIRIRADENGNDRFYLLLEGFGQSAIFSVAPDDIDGGIAANIDKIKSITAIAAGYIESQVDWNQMKAETFNGNEFDKERFQSEADRYKAMLDGYTGPVTKVETDSTNGATPSAISPETIPDTNPVAVDEPVVATPDLDDPKFLVDTIAANDTNLFDPDVVGGWGEPETGADAVLRELVRTTRDFGDGEIMIDIDVVDTGVLDSLATAITHVGVDVGLAVVGAVNPMAGLTIAFGKNAKETYDYAISKGLTRTQAIFAATTAGAVGGADTYVVGMGMGKVAGWVGPALKSFGTGATTQAVEHGIGTAGNASGFSLVGNVGKALVDKIADKNSHPELYQRARPHIPTGPGQVTYIMSGGAPWQANAMQ